MSLQISAVLLSLSVLSSAGTPCTPPLVAGLREDALAFARTQFDYVVIGAGTAGMVLASRLAENPRVTVGVIEAGMLHMDDRTIDLPVLSGVGNTTYDWMFTSAPQSHASGRVLSLPSGRMVGGSSGINNMAWGRASSVEYDALQQFSSGFSGWTWDELLPYFRRTERLSLFPSDPYPGVSSTSALENRVLFDGLTGPISVSHNTHYFDTALDMASSLIAAEVPANPSPLSGNTTGVWNSHMSFDRTAGVRSYAARDYYCTHSHLGNLRVLTNAKATKVVLTPQNSGLVATGVEIVFQDQREVVNAAREVIISAGTVQTVQLLELSGVGNRTLLERLGVRVLQDLPQVGENLQEHWFVGAQWRTKQGTTTFDILRNNSTFAEEQNTLYDRTRTGLLTESDSTVAFIPLPSLVDDDRLRELLQHYDRHEKETTVGSVKQLQDRLVRNWMSGVTVPAVELITFSRGFVFPAANASYVTLLGGILHPSSRGNIHINSVNPLASPVIDPNILSQDFDAQVLLDTLKFMIKLGKTSPFSKLVAQQTYPPSEVQSDEDLISYIRATAAGAHHLIGTVAMAPRDAGGVVDGVFKVYGTTNLRVVDASIIPIHLGCHVQATLYAIAEKAADVILASELLGQCQYADDYYDAQFAMGFSSFT